MHSKSSLKKKPTQNLDMKQPMYNDYGNPRDLAAVLIDEE